MLAGGDVRVLKYIIQYKLVTRISQFAIGLGLVNF